MELEDLLLKRFRVFKIEGEMVVREHYQGNYKAMSADDLYNYLTTGTKALNMSVKLGKGRCGPWGTKWHNLT